MNSVYVVRWTKKYINDDGCYETESGNFEQCYLNEESAIKAMVEDLENTKAECAEDCCDPKKDLHNHITSDYCLLNDDWKNETYEWYVDKLDIED